MREVYGAGVSAKQILKDGHGIPPYAIGTFPTTLASYSPRTAK